MFDYFNLFPPQTSDFAAMGELAEELRKIAAEYNVAIIPRFFDEFEIVGATGSNEEVISEKVKEAMSKANKRPL